MIYLDLDVTRNLAVTSRNHQIGIQNVVCPSVNSCDVWLVVDCPSQLHLLQLSLTSITQSQQPWEKSAAAQVTLHSSINNCPITTCLPPSFSYHWCRSSAPLLSMTCVHLLSFFVINYQIDRIHCLPHHTVESSYLHHYPPNHHAPTTIL